MAVQYAQLGAALLSGSIIPSAAAWLWRRLRRDPRSEAEARKLNAEASRTEWQTLRDEIDRLSETVRTQGSRIAELEQQAEVRADREEALEQENRRLRAEVGRLRVRVEGLEKILKVGPITPEMQSLLDELDRKTAGPGDKKKES